MANENSSSRAPRGGIRTTGESLPTARSVAGEGDAGEVNEPRRGSCGTIIPEGFPAEFCVEGEPCSGVAARASFKWATDSAPELLRRLVGAVMGSDEGVDDFELASRARAAKALAKYTRAELRAAERAAEEAYELAAKGAQGPGPGLALRRFTEHTDRAARAAYFARGIAAAVAWERAENTAAAGES